MATQPKSKKDSIQDKTTPEIEQLPFLYIEKHANKTTKLLANSGATVPVEGQSKWFSFEFNEPVFIYRVVVNATNYPDYNQFEIEVITDAGATITTSSKPSSGRVFVEVNEYCSSVKFRPPQVYFSSNKSIDSVEIYGFSRADAGDFIQFSRDIDSLKNEAIADIGRREDALEQTIQRASEATAQNAQAQTEFSKLKGSSERLKDAIRKLENEKNEAETKIGSGNTELNSLRSTISKLSAENDVKSKERDSLTKQISTSTETLANLKSNIDLFPSELDSFVKQGARNARTLFWLALAPILVIVILFFLLIAGAAELSTKNRQLYT